MIDSATVSQVPSLMQWCPLCSLDWLGKGTMPLQVEEWRKVRKRMGLPMAARGAGAQEMAAMAQSLTRAQLQAFVSLCRRRYEAKRVDPGQRSLDEYYICISRCTFSLSKGHTMHE